MTRSRTTCLVAVAVAAGVLTLTSCGGGSGEPSDPDTAGASSSPTASESSVEPGTGEVAEINGAQLQPPSGWTVEVEDGSPIVSAPDDELDYSPGFGILNADVTLADNTEELATAATDTASDAKRLADVKFGGVTFFHIRRSNDTNTYDTYGTVIEDSEVTVAWTFINDLADAKQRDALINQAMSTFKFKG
ncbi:hypothetical protein ABT304_04965 [Nocardioides sp. NPDC000445]|uniref:hypothetical protein n=1 Tax=Nocardioides sp. NPDC000445 TaxID=3154257 RepID=UPI00332334A8